ICSSSRADPHRKSRVFRIVLSRIFSKMKNLRSFRLLAITFVSLFLFNSTALGQGGRAFFTQSVNFGLVTVGKFSLKPIVIYNIDTVYVHAKLSIPTNAA